jgi:hypothetical protein
MRTLLRTIVVCFSLVAVGCGDDSGPQQVVEEVVPVAGTLTYKGRPLEYFQVTLQPEDTRRPAIGVTDSAGKFKMTTNAEGDGAVTGKLKIGVVWVGPPPADTGANEQIIDDPSKLPKPSVKIPEKYHSPDSSGLTQEIPAGGVTDMKIDLQ